MKGLFIVGLLMAAVLANPISDRLDKMASNLTHLWDMVHDMEEHHGDGVHIHLETHDGSGEHHHETSHLDKKGNDAHVYLHMDMHDPFDDMVTMTEYSGMDHDHHDEHGEHDEDHSDEDPDMHGEHSGHKKMVHHHHHHHHHHHGHTEMKEAHCDLIPNSADKPFKGHIHMKQLEGNLMSVHVDFDCPSDVKPGSKLALHVHEGSDMSQKCDSLGGHYNPHGVKHGARTDSHNHRHVGDWSNVVCDINNEVDHEFFERMTQLSGPHSILNRSIVLHLGADDHGMGASPESKMSGAAGNRFACCIIQEKLD